MQFKQALRAAGLPNPGRTTWCGVAADGVAVFTIWSYEIHRRNGRHFAWWDHDGPVDAEGEPSSHHKARCRRFVSLAAENLGVPCRAVILHRKSTPSGVASVGDAVYPHPTMSRVIFRSADVDALQYIAELIPGD